MRKIFIGLGLLVVLLIAAIVILPGLIPSSVYKDKIQTQLSTELGRDVVISGDVKLSVFPMLAAQTGRVDIANPDGFGDSQFASMDGMKAKVRLMPLFKKQVEISAFILDAPTINLIKAKNGSANWVMGKPDAAPKTKANTGPFKRDGRFAEVDPKIGLFEINDGTVTYDDRMAGKKFAAEEVNMGFSLPSLSDPIEIDGSLVFNGEPAKIDLRLETPRAFLDGKAAPLALSLKTDFADIKAKGAFAASQDIAADINLNADISDVSALIDLVPAEVPYGDLAQTVKLSGDYSFDGKILRAKNASIAAKGESFEGRFEGNATLSDTPVLDGKVDANVSNVPALLAALEQDVKGAELIQTASLSADFASQGDGFTAQNINAKANGEGLRAEYTGTGAFAKDDVSIAGTFDVQADDPSAITAALDMDIPEASLVGVTKATGDVNFKNNVTTVSNLIASTKSDVIDGEYTGGITAGETIALNGDFKANVSQLPEISRRLGKEVPYSNSIGNISANGRLDTVGQNLNISALTAALTNGQINGRFDGSATAPLGGTANDALSLNGKLKADIPSIRAIAQTQNIILPPNSKEGDIYEAFSVEGEVTGSPAELTFNNANIILDDIKGKGNFAANMSGAKPYVTGALDLEGLNLKPYMAAYAAQKEEGAIEPWSEERIEMAALRAVDGKFDITTPFVKTGRMDMGQTDINATLRGGKLDAKMPSLAMYGGVGSLNAELDASQEIPAIALDVDLSSLNSNSFLSAIAGFTNATGEGGTKLSIRGSGLSQAAIMKSLAGQGDFSMLNGQVSGVDVSQFLTGIEKAVKSRALPSGVGPSHITKFQDLAGLFTIENGVAKVGRFTLSGNGISAEGQGQIDLGGQSIDFSLQPKLVGSNAKGLAAFGVPIRYSGKFGSASASLDTKLLMKVAEAHARAKASEEVTSLITDQIGGNAGSALGGIAGNLLGGNNNSGTPQASTPNDNSAASGDSGQAAGTEEVVGDLIGGLLGGNSSATESSGAEATPAETPSAEEEIVEDLIGGLFGKKKKSGSE